MNLEESGSKILVPQEGRKIAYRGLLEAVSNRIKGFIAAIDFKSRVNL